MALGNKAVLPDFKLRDDSVVCSYDLEGSHGRNWK